MSDTKNIPLIDSNESQARSKDDVSPLFSNCQQLCDHCREDPTLKAQPLNSNEYHNVLGTCCDTIIGHVGIPVGVVGHVIIDSHEYQIPMATTEGALVKGISRGCRATYLGGGIQTRLISNSAGMSQCPVIRFLSATAASNALSWLVETKSYVKFKQAFESCSQFVKLGGVRGEVAGSYLLIRFEATSLWDTMEMSLMILKGTKMALQAMKTEFPQMKIMTWGGNYCPHRSSAAVNWIDGCRNGNSVVAEAIIPAAVVAKVLKTNVAALVEYYDARNFVKTATNGSTGGFNSLSAKIVSAILLATGQDVAKSVESSSCMMSMEPWGETGEDLLISCAMPSIEVWPGGGCTGLAAQNSCLQMLGLSASNTQLSDKNARVLARIICGVVLAGKLSLMSALANEHFVSPTYKKRN